MNEAHACLMHDEIEKPKKKCCSLSVHRLIFKDFLLRHNEEGVCRQQKFVPVPVPNRGSVMQPPRELRITIYDIELADQIC